MHTTRTTIGLPAGIKPQMEPNRWQVKAFINQMFNEAQSFKVILGIETLTTPSAWMYYSSFFPDAYCLGMYMQKLRNDSYGIDWIIRHNLLNSSGRILY